MHLTLGPAVASMLASATIPPPAATPFSAELAIVADPAQFIREWDQPAVNTEVRVLTSLKPDQPATVFVLFRACHAASDGACHVKADIAVIGPERKPTPLTGSFVVWSKAKPVAGMVYRSEQAPTITLPADAPLGTYTVRVTVTNEGDPQSPAVVIAERTLTLQQQ